MGYTIGADGNPQVSPLAGSEVFVCRQTTVKDCAVSAVATYANAALLAAGDASPTSGDVLLGKRSGTAKSFGLDAVAAYAAASTWSGASEVSPAVSGDLVQVNRSGTVRKLTVDTLASYVLAGAQAGILDLSGLDAATLGATDVLLVCQTGVAKSTTLSALETKLWADYATYAGALTAATSAGDTDKLYMLQTGAPKSLTPAVLADYMQTKIGAGIVAGAWAGDAVTPALGTDVVPLQRGGALKTATVTTLANFATAALGASDPVSPLVTGDALVLFRSGTAKTGTIDSAASYVLSSAWSSAAVDPVQTGDKLFLGRSGASKTATVDVLKTFVLGGIQATVLDISGLGTATLGATDKLLVCQAGVAKSTALSALETKLWTDFATYAGDLADAVTVADADKFYLLKSGTPKHATGAEIASYASAKLWGAASVEAVLSGDEVLINRSGTGVRKVVVQTAGMDALRANVLNISGLPVGTLSGTDLVLACQGTAARRSTVAGLTSYVHDALAAYTVALEPATELADEDQFYLLQGGLPRRVHLETLGAHLSQPVSVWRTIPQTKYTALPASASQISMSDTSDMAAGLPVRYTYDNVTYYGIVVSVATSTSITIAGPELSLTEPLTELCVGPPERVAQVEFTIRGLYGESEREILAPVGGQYFAWRRSEACLVGFALAQRVRDTGANQPAVTVKINDNMVALTGIRPSHLPGVWVTNTPPINPAYYGISYGQPVGVRCTQAGTNGNAQDLTVSCTFVLK